MPEPAGAATLTMTPAPRTLKPERKRGLRFRVGLASTASILTFGLLIGLYFIHKEYQYRLSAVSSEIKKSAYFLVPQASMLLIQNDASAFLTFTRIVERIAGKNNFAYVEIVDVKGNVKVPLDPLGARTSRRRFVREGPWGALAMGRDYLIHEEEYKDAGRVIEGVFGVLEQDKILGYVILGVSKRPILEAVWKSLYATLGALVLLLVLSVTLSLRFTRKAIEPVVQLTNAVESFKASSDLEVFNIGGPREVSVLASSMKGAFAKIQDHQAEIERTIASIKASEGKTKQEMKIISDSFRKLSKHLKLDEAVVTILEDIVRQIVYCHEAHILLKVSEDGNPIGAGDSYVTYPKSRAARCGAISNDLLEKVLKKGDLEAVADARDAVWKGKIHGNFHSCVIYPLFSAQNVPLGVLFLGMVSATPFDSEELLTLRGVMEPIGIAFDRIFLHSQVEKLAIHDSMTGLYNRHHVRERLYETFKRARRQGEAIYVLLADIDHFKMINDGYGHPAGDKVIRSLSGIIQSSMRVGEYAGRYGGEEFLIVLGASDLEGARTFAERILREIRACRVEIDPGKKIAFTISMGAAAFPMDGDSLDEVIENADEALYLAKEGGRDRAVIWNVETKDPRPYEEIASV